jgi:hypothetical protein
MRVGHRCSGSRSPLLHRSGLELTGSDAPARDTPGLTSGVPSSVEGSEQAASSVPPLVLTGGPAVGKSTTARGLLTERRRAALIEVDDIRQLVAVGGSAPWEGAEGMRQQRLGVQNACAVAGNFVTANIDVVIADVVNPDTCALYRTLLPSCLIVRLVVSWPEAGRRAATRRMYLTTTNSPCCTGTTKNSHRQPTSLCTSTDLARPSRSRRSTVLGSLHRKGRSRTVTLDGRLAAPVSQDRRPSSRPGGVICRW